MKWLARLWFRLSGWTFAGNPPTIRKYVALGVPHTSNWDFVMFLAVTSHFAARHVVAAQLGVRRRLGSMPDARACCRATNGMSAC